MELTNSIIYSAKLGIFALLSSLPVAVYAFSFSSYTHSYWPVLFLISALLAGYSIRCTAKFQSVPLVTLVLTSLACSWVLYAALIAGCYLDIGYNNQSSINSYGGGYHQTSFQLAEIHIYICAAIASLALTYYLATTDE